MQPEQTTTPFRQLYFAVQAMLIDPGSAPAAKQHFDAFHGNLCNVVSRQELLDALAEVRRLVEAKRHFEALKTLRMCFPMEDEIIRFGSKQKQ